MKTKMMVKRVRIERVELKRTGEKVRVQSPHI